MNRPIILAVCLLTANAAQAGVRYTSTTEFPGQDRTETMEMLVDSERLRLDGSEGDGFTVLFDGGSEQMTIVDHADKTYMVLDKAQVEQMAAQMSQAMQGMQQALENMPQAQRDEMEKMMKQRMGQMGGGAPAAEPEITDLDESGSVGGMSCDWKAVRRDGVLALKICVGDWSDVPGGEEMVAVQKKMVEFSASMREAFSQAGPMAQAFNQGAIEEVTLGGGFPLITERHSAGYLTERSTFQGAENVSASDADFAPPEGYERQEMGNPGGQRRGRRN